MLGGGARAAAPGRPAPGPRQRRPRAAPLITTCSAGQRAKGLTLRRGTAADLRVLLAGVLSEALNPLVFDTAAFTVAEGEGGAPLGFGQLRPLRGGALELASLVTLKAHRGRGVASAVVADLIRRAGGAPLWLITTSGRAGFYERLGFGVVPPDASVPPALAAERAVGSLVARLVANDSLVVMRHRGGGGEQRGE